MNTYSACRTNVLPLLCIALRLSSCQICALSTSPRAATSIGTSKIVARKPIAICPHSSSLCPRSSLHFPFISICHSKATDDVESEDTIEGFGVGEKSLEFESLVDISEEGLQEEITTVAPTLDPKTVLRFVAPTLALWIAPPVMSLIDTSVVGRYCGPIELAALGPGCTLIDSSAYLFMFVATAATNMVATARASGSNDNSDGDATAQRIIGEALFLALCSGVFLAAVTLGAGEALTMAIAGKESAAVVPSALKYATVRAYGQPFVIMASVARAAALAQKDTKTPLLSVAVAFLLNAIGTVGLVRGTDLGIVGAAIATLCADIAATLFLLIRMQSSRRINGSSDETAEPSISPLIVVPTFSNFKRFAQYAAPIFFTILGKSVVYNGIAVSVGRMGSVALAAHQVLLRSFFFWTPVGDSIGMTSQVFLPGILAEEDRTGVPQRGAKRLLFGIGVISGLLAATLAGALPSKGSAFFTKDNLVATALKKTAPILAISVSMHAIALTCEGILLAQRDLKFLSSSYVTTTIAAAALLLSPLRPATLAGSWWILALFQGGRALQFALRSVWISRQKELSLSTSKA